jgi:hypothetical protein
LDEQRLFRRAGYKDDVAHEGVRNALVYFGLADESEANSEARTGRAQPPLSRRAAASAIVAAVMVAFLIVVGETLSQAVAFAVLLNVALLAVSLVLDRR